MHDNQNSKLEVKLDYTQTNLLPRIATLCIAFNTEIDKAVKNVEFELEYLKEHGQLTDRQYFSVIEEIKSVQRNKIDPELIKSFKNEGHCTGMTASILVGAWLDQQELKHSSYGIRDDLTWLQTAVDKILVTDPNHILNLTEPDLDSINAVLEVLKKSDSEVLDEDPIKPTAAEKAEIDSTFEDLEESLKKMLSLTLDSNFSHYISTLEFLHSPHHYLRGGQGELQESLGNVNDRKLTKEFAFTGEFSPEDFTKKIGEKQVFDVFFPENRLVLASIPPIHDIGWYRNKDFIYFIDANNNKEKFYKKIPVNETRSVLRELYASYLRYPGNHNISLLMGIRIFSFENDGLKYPDPQDLRRILKHDKSNSFKYACNESPLAIAAWIGDLSGVEYYVNKGVNINETRADGFSPLELAIKQNFLEISEHLINHSANTNFLLDRQNADLFQLETDNSMRLLMLRTTANGEIKQEHLDWLRKSVTTLSNLAFTDKQKKSLAKIDATFNANDEKDIPQKRFFSVILLLLDEFNSLKIPSAHLFQNEAHKKFFNTFFSLLNTIQKNFVKINIGLPKNIIITNGAMLLPPLPVEERLIQNSHGHWTSSNGR